MPFGEVKVERVRVTRYRSTFDMTTRLESARTELATDKTELFKILLLASMIGLRRHEIDLLPWSAFRWDEGIVRTQATEHFRPKSHESESDIPVDQELLARFRAFHAKDRLETLQSTQTSGDALDETLSPPEPPPTPWCRAGSTPSVKKQIPTSLDTIPPTTHSPGYDSASLGWFLWARALTTGKAVSC